jgi:hypothetical protein
MGAKATFVRNNPDVPAQDLLTQAEKQGIPLTVGYIYNIRAADKAKKVEGKAPSRGPGRPRASSGLDAELRTLIIRIGLDRAEQIFADLKASLSPLNGSRT